MADLDQAGMLMDPRSPESQDTATAHRSGQPNDSGYVSQAGTRNTTPNETPNTTPCTTPSKTALSEGSSTSRAASISFSFPALRFTKTEKLVPMLDKEVDEPSKVRFQAIKPRFEKLLLEHILNAQRPGTKYKPMATRIIMMGTSTKGPSAHIVVLCQPEQKDVVQRFLRDPIIQDLCDGVPSLKIAVLGYAPRLRLAVDVVADAVRATASSPRITFCGTPIQLQHVSGRVRSATFGGFVKVVTNEGKIRIHGITAGHALQELEDGTEIEDSPSGVEGKDPVLLLHRNIEPDLECIGLVEENDDDLLAPLADQTEYADADDDESNTDLGYCLIREEHVSQAATEPWSFATPTHIGSVICASGSRDNRSGFYDWALFETSDYVANKLPTQTMATLVLSHRIPGATGTRPIYMISASTGVKEGQMSPEAGSILLGSGEEFVDAYLVTINGEQGNGICDGDSGSWVVDRNTYELYGHLVATDAFNTGYVIPMEGIFADIKHHLHALAVGLPDNIDILHCRTALEEAGAMSSNDHSPSQNLPAVFHQESDPSPRPATDSGYSSLWPSPRRRWSFSRSWSCENPE